MMEKRTLVTSVLVSTLTLTPMTAVSESPKLIGNGLGRVQSVEGPKIISVEMGDCNFSLSLAINQHIIFNGPDTIFYSSPKQLSFRDTPFLWQAEMSTGYDWSFQKRGALDTKWFGIMCEDKNNFPWSDNKKSESPPSPEMAQIMVSNAARCPARFQNGKWIPLEKNDVFRELHGKSWNGFLAAMENRKKPNTLQSIRFCLVHNDEVIVGSSENQPGKLNIPKKFITQIEKLLSTLEFNEPENK